MNFGHSGWNKNDKRGYEYYCISVILSPAEKEKLGRAINEIEEKTGGTFYISGTNNYATLSLPTPAYNKLRSNKGTKEVNAAFKRILQPYI